LRLPDRILLKTSLSQLILITDGTFRGGDPVRIGGNAGMAERVGFRATRTCGLEDSLPTSPKADLPTADVANFGARRFRRSRTKITVPYATPPDIVREFRDGMLELIRHHPAARPEKREVAMNDSGGSGIEILDWVFIDVSDGHAAPLARDGLILEVVRLGIAHDEPGCPGSR
jgi:MscS family membrane protein